MQQPCADTVSPAARPTRLAFAIFGLGPGGAERVTCTLSGYTARRGWDVRVVTMSAARGDAYALPPAVRRISLDLASDSHGSLEAIVHSLQRIATLRRVLRSLDPDVVVSFMPETNVLCLLAMWGTGVPVLVCERTDPRMAPLGRRWKLLRRALYPRAAGVAVQTECVARWARAFCPRVHVIPNSVDRPHRFASALDAPGPKRLLAVGRLVPVKGFDLLIRAFAIAARDRPDWSLTILGEGRLRARLTALAEECGVAARISMPGHVPDPTEHLTQGHAFALSSRCEGFPNALLEAMACGLPAVAFDCPSGPADVITNEHDGLLVPAEDVPAFAAALGRIMDSPRERVRMGLHAREIATKLAPELILPQWMELLDAIARRS